jgi:hypothetical protein
MSDIDTPSPKSAPEPPTEHGVAFGQIHTIPTPTPVVDGGSGESKPLRFHSVIRSPAPPSKPTSTYSTIADDVDWLRTEWTRDEPPSDGHIRRGSATLRHLLVDDLLGEAWRAHGFAKSPLIVGPDLAGLLRARGFEMRHVVSGIAGGGRKNSAIWAASVGLKVTNSKTGVGPDAEEGFALATLCVVMSADRRPASYPEQAWIERQWPLANYLDAIGAIRRGGEISRRIIIQYAANYAGGVHLERAQKRFPKTHEKFELAAELERFTHVDDMNGLNFELLSIGQAIATSPDILKLVGAIRAAEH